LAGVLDCFLQRRRRAAGENTGAGELRVSSNVLIHCKIYEEEGLGRCAVSWGRR
jgi:hypothetical protein